MCRGVGGVSGDLMGVDLPVSVSGGSGFRVLV